MIKEGPECGEILLCHLDSSSRQCGSAALLLEDVNYETVVPLFVKQLMANTEQWCNALLRMIVPTQDDDKVVELSTNTIKLEIVGDSRIIFYATINSKRY